MIQLGAIRATYLKGAKKTRLRIVVAVEGGPEPFIAGDADLSPACDAPDPRQVENALRAIGRMVANAEGLVTSPGDHFRRVREVVEDLSDRCPTPTPVEEMGDKLLPEHTP